SQETRGRVRVEEGRKRVRVYLGGALVADTTHPRLVWEAPYYPTYYLPAEDVRAKLEPTGRTERSPSRGEPSCTTSWSMGRGRRRRRGCFPTRRWSRCAGWCGSTSPR